MVVKAAAPRLAGHRALGRVLGLCLPAAPRSDSSSGAIRYDTAHYEHAYLPDLDRVMDGVDRVLAY